MEREQLLAVARALAHRGPDSEGVWLAPWLGLAHRRLSIIDLSEASNQPLLDPEGRHVLVFNGQIYNYRELAERFLTGDPHVNRRSDTSVLLRLYAKLGPGCLEHLNGMFAFAVADLERRTVFLARDRFGEKPLYWARIGDRLLFGSEIAALKALYKGSRWTIDPLVLALYHVMGSVPAPLTIYSGVHALPPGSFMEIGCDGRVEIRAYWSLREVANRTANQPVLPHEESRRACAEALCRAVESRMVSDVPVGIFLSGGLDSSAILALHAHLGLPGVDALCIDFAQQEFSEFDLARESATAFGARLHRRLVTPEGFLEALDDFFRASDQPTTDGFNTFFVSREAAALGIKVWLSGVGGDEVFGGYRSFRELGRLKWLSKAAQAALPTWIQELGVSAWPRWPRLSRLAHLAVPGPHPIRAYQAIRNAVPWRNASTMLARARWRPEWPFPQCLDASYPQVSAELSSFTQASVMELGVYMAFQLLRDMDNYSMTHSIELRAPFLDHRLVETVMAAGSGSKSRPGLSKPLLLDSLPIPLPPLVARQPKRGFTFPLQVWMRDHLVHSFREHVLAEENGALWDLEEVERIWNGFLDGRIQWSVPWVLYSLARWLKAHDEHA